MNKKKKKKIKTPSLSLYQMCRHQLGFTLPELVPVRIYNKVKRKEVVIWLHASCGPGSEFHTSMRACGKISVRKLAIGCGFRQTGELSQGLMVFIHNLVFGNIRYHELYYGQCEMCSTYYCHLDRKIDHPCQNN